MTLLQKTSICSVLLLNSLFTVVFAQTDEECLDCHSDPELVSISASGETVPVYVNEEDYSNGVHAGVGLECISCHSDIIEYHTKMTLCLWTALYVMMMLILSTGPVSTVTFRSGGIRKRRPVQVVTVNIRSFRQAIRIHR